MTAFMQVVSFIGSAGCYVPVLVAVFWCVNPRAGAWAAVLLTISGALNVLLKVAIHAPRPFWTDPGITAHQPLTSFGMPSGHAQGATVAYGLLGWRVLRGAPARPARATWASVAAVVAVVAVVVSVGVSRVYLGVHSAGQVFAGWLIGGALLLAARALGPAVVRWWRSRRWWVQPGLGLAVALAFLAPTALAVHHLRGWRMPDAWTRAIDAAGGTVTPVTLTDGAGVTGILFGVLAGLSVLAYRGWFDPGGSPWRRIARLPVGAAGAGVILLCGSLAGHASAGVFVTGAAVGAWMVGGAPEAFVRLRLAARTPPQVRHAGEPIARGRS